MSQRRLRLVETADGRNYLLPFVLVTTLFFLWGFAHSILDVLNKHFQETMHISRTGSALVQAVVYGGYFLMALPAGSIITRYGYRAGVLTGLLLYGAGALLFYPGSHLLSFPFFLFSLFVIGCGLTCLETAANPYVTVLGHSSAAASRINLAQSFNGLGWIVGPIVGSFFLFSGSGEADLATPYVVIGLVVLCVAGIFAKVRLPEVQPEAADGADEGTAAHDHRSLWSHGHFVMGLCALFFYVAAQTGINSFFINYTTEIASLSNAEAAQLLSFGGMGLFMAGRMSGSYVMGRVRPALLLLVYALIAAVCMALVSLADGRTGMAALMVCYLCESIMFPTIFALALRGVGRHTKQASGFLIMSIVGGAVAPVLMGAIGDHIGMSQAFLVPLVCFLFIAAYGFCTLTRWFRVAQ